MTKKVKEFKFQQNLRIEFTKNDEFFQNKIFAGPWFDSEKTEFNNIDKLLNIQHNQHSSRVERWKMKDQVELLIQYYNISLLFQKPLLVKEVLIFHYLKN